MSGVIATIPKFQFSSNGVPMVEGTLETYFSGTTTPAATYQDQALSIANTNPIVLDSRGECVLWLDPTKEYKFILKNKQGVTQWTQDDIGGAANSATLATSIGASLIGYIDAGAGATAASVQAALRNGALNLKTFGLSLDGVTDDTAKWAQAIATGKHLYWPPNSPSFVTDKVTLQNGQILQGSGRTSSYFVIDGTFNLAATSVLQLGTGEPGAQAFDIGFQFAQADQAVRANVTAYPPAIDGSDIPRFVIDRIRIEGAYDGIKATGNAGGCYIGFIEVGSLRRGLDVDGALDFIHGGHWHFWPFGMSSKTNLLTVYYDGVGEAASVGLADGFEVDSISTFRQKINVTASASSSIPLQIGRLQLDGDGARLIVAGGRVLASLSYSTKTSASSAATVDVSGGICILSSHVCSSNSAGYELRASGGTLIANGGEISSINPAATMARVDAGTLTLDGVRIKPSASAYSQPHVIQAAGALKVKNCNWAAAGAGTGIAVFYVSDGAANECHGNDFGGWQYGPPASMTLGKYNGNNNTISTDIIGNEVVGNLKTKRLTVTADGSGAYVGPHGITSGQTRVLSALAYYKGASGEMVPATLSSVDGTNVTFSGATAGARLRVAITYTEASDAW